jgi:hypothetical protein
LAAAAAVAQALHLQETVAVEAAAEVAALQQ